ncbi:hypothetical protein Lepto7375DRAFT_8304 [Leptolyngbya sp. PCC 7375]|nr:hypothetical protein Lepto7375DRAFT_8304 [Leptolyngbya sp. PCC 7375]
MHQIKPGYPGIEQRNTILRRLSLDQDKVVKWASYSDLIFVKF